MSAGSGGSSPGDSRGNIPHELLDATLSYKYTGSKNAYFRKPMALIKKLRKKKKEAPANEKPDVVKTHLRNMVIKL